MAKYSEIVEAHAKECRDVAAGNQAAIGSNAWMVGYRVLNAIALVLKNQEQDVESSRVYLLGRALARALPLRIRIGDEIRFTITTEIGEALAFARSELEMRQ